MGIGLGERPRETVVRLLGQVREQFTAGAVDDAAACLDAAARHLLCQLLVDEDNEFDDDEYVRAIQELLDTELALLGGHGDDDRAAGRRARAHHHWLLLDGLVSFSAAAEAFGDDRDEAGASLLRLTSARFAAFPAEMDSDWLSPPWRQLLEHFADLLRLVIRQEDPDQGPQLLTTVVKAIDDVDAEFRAAIPELEPEVVLAPVIGAWLMELRKDAVNVCFDTAVDMFDEAFKAAEGGDFSEFATVMDQTREMLELAAACRDLMPGDEPGPDARAASTDDDDLPSRAELAGLVLTATVFREMWSGTAYMLLEQYPSAGQVWERAVTAVRALQRDAVDIVFTAQWLPTLAGYLEMMVVACSAADARVRGHYDVAGSRFRRAAVGMDDLIRRATPGDEAEEQMLHSMASDAHVCRGRGLEAEYLQAMADGEFSLAHELAERAGDAFAGAASILPEGSPELARAGIDRAQWSARAVAFMALAHRQRERREFDEAIQAMTDAKESMQQGADAVLRSGLPNAGEIQEQMLRTVLMTRRGFVRQCRSEQELHDEVRRLQVELAALRKAWEDPRGVTVHAVASSDAGATAEASASAIAEAAVRGVRDNLRRVVELLPAVGLPEAERSALRDEATRLLSADEPPSSLVDKARRFAERLASVVAPLGRTADAVLPIVNALGG